MDQPRELDRILGRVSVRPIVLLGDPRLRLRGEPVESFGRFLHNLLDDLTHTMRHAPGVGLAAPQIGEGLAACVVECAGQMLKPGGKLVVKLFMSDELPGYVSRLRVLFRTVSTTRRG